MAVHFPGCSNSSSYVTWVLDERPEESQNWKLQWACKRDYFRIGWAVCDINFELFFLVFCILFSVVTTANVTRVLMQLHIPLMQMEKI